jgi:hypothetical protein
MFVQALRLFNENFARKRTIGHKHLLHIYLQRYVSILQSIAMYVALSGMPAICDITANRRRLHSPSQIVPQ